MSAASNYNYLFNNLFCKNQLGSQTEFHKGIKIDFTTTQDVANTRFDDTSYVHDDEAVLQDTLVTVGNTAGSNEFYPNLGNSFQKNTLNYALTSDILLQHEANFASTDCTNFINTYIADFNDAYLQLTSSNTIPTTTDEIEELDAVPTINLLTLTPKRVTYDYMILGVTMDLSNGKTLGNISYLNNINL